MDSTPENPYRVGQTIRLQHESTGCWYADVTIKRAWPVTVAVVLLVVVNDTSDAFTELPEQAILKIYDRRYCHNYRRHQMAGKYTLLLEHYYQSFVAKGWDSARQITYSEESIEEPEAETSEDIDEPDDEEEAEEDEEEDGLSEGVQAWAQEARLQHAVLDDWGKERTAYERLRSMQGQEIPFMYAAMMIDAPGKPSDIISLPCGALLLEYIDGQSLEDVAQYLPPSEFHKIYQATLAILHRIARLGVVNRDAVARDWLLRKDAGSGYQPVQVDFGQARMRGHEDLQEWLNIAYGTSQEDRMFLSMEHLYASRYLLRDHDYYRFYQIHPAPMDELMFDLDSMVPSEKTELTSTLRGCAQEILPTSSTVHDGFTSFDGIMRLCSPAASTSPDGSISDEVGMPTPPDSPYNFNENKARLRSQSLPTSLLSWTSDACAWEKNLKLPLSPNEIDYARNSILDWRQANTTIHSNDNEVTGNGRIHTIDLTEEIPFPGQSFTRHYPRVISTCRIANDSINEGAKATTYFIRPNDQANHQEHIKALKAKKG